MKRSILVVVAARPNFVKAAPLVHALEADRTVAVKLLHTGQHYDPLLSDSFMEQLALPTPHYHLGVGSGTHGEQTAAVIVGVERVLVQERPAAIVVVGDVNSTAGAAIASAKLGVPIVHLEAGLRSGDRSMPEEINRLITDAISDLLLCHCQEAVENLLSEGAPASRVQLVGNTMIDSLFRLLPAAHSTGIVERLGLEAGTYGLVTLHRPGLVDSAKHLSQVVEALSEVVGSLPIVFPVHPRTRARLESLDKTAQTSLHLLDPLSYLEFVGLEAAARLVITDSGGVQEETSALGIPCFTYRTTTERAVTIEHGTNMLVGTDAELLLRSVFEELASPRPLPTTPIPLWDGLAGKRAADAVLRLVKSTEDECHTGLIPDPTRRLPNHDYP